MRLIPTLALIVNGNNGSATLGHRADATRLVPHRGTDAKGRPETHSDICNTYCTTANEPSTSTIIKDAFVRTSFARGGA